MKSSKDHSRRDSRIVCDELKKSFFNNYKGVVNLLNETRAIDKEADKLAYDRLLNDLKQAFDNLEIKYNQMLEMFGIQMITYECKEKYNELAGQICAMYASNCNCAEYKDKALNFYINYQITLQRYKLGVFEDKDDVVVYSFRKYSVYTLEDLINNTITVVRPSKMNDPFDSIANFWRKTECLNKITGGRGHEEILNKSMDYYRIRSFQANTATYDTDNNVLQNVKMWSNYADNHCGFCIKYRLNRSIFKKIDETEKEVLRLAPVQYVHYYKIATDKIKLNTFEAFFLKHTDWNEEGEVRLLSYNAKTNNDHYAVPMGDDARIEEIIFGVQCKNDCKRTIYNLLSHKGVKFYEMISIPETDIYHLVKKEYVFNNSEDEQKL